jgi:hypothetical protein
MIVIPWILFQLNVNIGASSAVRDSFGKLSETSHQNHVRKTTDIPLFGSSAMHKTRNNTLRHAKSGLACSKRYKSAGGASLPLGVNFVKL